MMNIEARKQCKRTMFFSVRGQSFLNFAQALDPQAQASKPPRARSNKSFLFVVMILSLLLLLSLVPHARTSSNNNNNLLTSNHHLRAAPPSTTTNTTTTPPHSGDPSSNPQETLVSSDNNDPPPARIGTARAGIANVEDVGTVPQYHSDQGPSAITIVSRTEDAVKLKWSAPPNTQPVMYNLLMNRVSIYSGPKTYFEEVGLSPEHCYTFQVAAYINGRWTKFSPAMRVASMQHSVDVEKIDQGIKAARGNIKKAAQARITGSPCLLDGIKHPSNVNGGPGYVEYIGSTGDFSVAGVDASVLNCQVSKCVDASSQALSLIHPLIGHLMVRLDDGSWKLRFIEIPPETNILEYNNPKNAFMKVTINLLGCRANSLSDEGGKLISKTGEAASKCLELNCTSELKQYFFCIPPGASLIEEHMETSQALTKADSLTEIATWIHGINRATIPRHTFQRYEVNLKANVAPLISDNPIKNLDKTIYSPTGYREPFYASFLTRLVKIDATPHFAQLLGTFRCTKLPDAFSARPDKVLGGILPPYRTGGPVAENVAKMKIDGDTFETLWMVMIQETFSTDLETVLNGYKGFALDNDWVRGIIFQLIQGIGVGYHSYGLHFNDLLTMSNIRFRQIPKKTALSRKYWCYDLNDIALSGDGCGQTSIDDEVPDCVNKEPGDQAGKEGKEGKEEEAGEAGEAGKEGDAEQTDSTAASFLETMADPITTALPMDFTDSPYKDSNGGLFTCTNGVDENNEMPADGLPTSECAALNSPKKMGEDGEDGEQGEDGDSNGGAKLRFKKAKVQDAAAEDGAADAKKERTSWCIEADKVDGLQVKLYNYGAASLAKKTIQWWKKGYTFPNTPWNDDMQSVAVILCGYIAQHVRGFDAEGRKLCTLMRTGYYRENPLHALRHAYFQDFLTKDQVVLENRNNYIYKPTKDCSCENNEKVGIKQRKTPKPCEVKPSSKTEDGVNEGQVIMAKMFGKHGDDKRRKEGEPVPPLDQDVVASTQLLDPPSAHSPMTPWIVMQTIVDKDDQLTGDSSGTITISMRWQRFRKSTLYNFMMDGVSVYTGANTAVTLNGLKQTKCYRFQVAAFGSTGWSSLSHALHVNDCGLREDW